MSDSSTVQRFAKLFIAVFTTLSLLSMGICIPAYASNEHVLKVYVNKARYSPGDTAAISVDLSNTSGSSWSGTLHLVITRNETSVYTTSAGVSLANGQKMTKTFTWTTPSTDYQGYMVKAYTTSSDYQTGAIDVSSKWTKYPRYGYIPNFDDSITQTKIDTQINAMTQDYYLNSFQFYDWMWRHEVPILKSNGTTPDASWTDLFGRPVIWNTIQSYLTAVHNKNAKGMAYMMSYAAREGYTDYGISPQWGIFEDTNHATQYNVNFNNGKYLWLFAPSNTNWQNFIVNAYKDCINTGGFDGIQMDQMGHREPIYNYSGASYDLPNSFSSLINAAKTQLNSNNSSRNAVTFNIVDGTVDGWAVDNVSKNANTDFNFSEIWWKSNNYNDMRNYIEQVRNNSNKKAMVIAAYMNYEQNSGPRYEAENATYNGVNVNTNHPGYSGTGFLENFAQQGDYVQFSVNANEAMTYSLVFQYGDEDVNATRTIYVDGNKVGQVLFHPQGTWDKFVFDAYINTYLTAGTHTVKVSYDSTDTGSINLDCMTLGQFNEPSVRLTDALFAASGATHIELGAGLDDITMLGHEYYPNTSKVVTGALKTAMKEHYKFITAYENLLFDPGINYGDQGNQYISIDGHIPSGGGSDGTIWHMTRMTTNYDILHLINLENENDRQWRNEASAPAVLSNLAVKYYLSEDSNISGVYVASPDSNHGLTQSLSYTTGTDSIGRYVSFTVPSLQYWDMVYVKRTIPVPSGNRYEAEKAIKTNVTTGTNHTGYTGTGFVDSFAEQGDEVTFQVNVSTAGTRTLAFKYANNTQNTATRHIFVDGAYVGTLNMSNLANWDTWGTASLSTSMTSGIHTVCMYYDTTDNWAINLDSLTVN